MTGSALTTSDAVLVGHAMTARIAQKEGFRALLVKGPLAAELGVRTPRPSSDVDVLVEPGRVSEMKRCLVAQGWSERKSADAPRFYPLHSASFYHHSWPCDIDVHEHFPGFFADRTTAFAHLWSRRSKHVIGGIDVYAPGSIDMALAVAAHSVRNQASDARAQELTQVASFLKADRSRLDSALESATVLRAVTALMPLWSAIGVDDELSPDLSESELQAWELLRQSPGDSSALHWLVAFRSRTRLARIRLALRAAKLLVLNRDGSDDYFHRSRRDRLRHGLREIQSLRREIAGGQPTRTPQLRMRGRGDTK